MVLQYSGLYHSNQLLSPNTSSLQILWTLSEDYADFPIQPRAVYRSLKDAGGWSAFLFCSINWIKLLRL